MRKFLKFIPIISILFVACNNGKQKPQEDTGAANANAQTQNAANATPGKFVVSGTILNKGTETTVFLDKINDTSVEVANTGALDANGNFSITAASAVPALYRIRCGQYTAPVIYNNYPAIGITLDMAKYNDYNVTGSPESNAIRFAWTAQAPSAAKVAAFVDTCRYPLAIWTVCKTIDPKQGNNLEIWKNANNRLQSLAPNADYALNFKKMIASFDKIAGIRLGGIAPDINLPNPDGKNMSLSALKGKVVLVDFWASWCRPCRANNPAVVNLYKKYKDKGFTVYSVSLDSKKDAWVQAIQADDLSWDSHVSELKSWYGVVNQEWNVNSIPQTFLLDKTGKIIALNAHGAELEQKVKAAL